MRLIIKAAIRSTIHTDVTETKKANFDAVIFEYPSNPVHIGNMPSIIYINLSVIQLGLNKVFLVFMSLL